VTPAQITGPTIRPIAERKKRRRLAINRLLDRKPIDDAIIDRFLERYGAPIVEGTRTTFLWRGEADEVMVRHRVVGLTDPLRLRRIRDTDLWYATTEMPEGSRVEYQFEIVHGDHHAEHVNDPLNPRVAHGPFGASSVCAATGYAVPDWCLPDPEARPGEIVEDSLASKAFRRQVPFYIYLPARFRNVVRYPLLIVHDGKDYLDYTAAKTVLDNLIHRNEIAEMVVAFVPPGNRLVEYANHAPHARFVARELVPYLAEAYPLVETPDGRTLMGSSFGGIASVSTASRYPGVFGSLFLESASLVFTDIGTDHGGGPAFDPVVKFVNGFRAKPKRIVERIYMTCGMYEPLIAPNRSMVTTFRETGMDVRYLEARDGHNWENWRDRLRDGLTWLHPGDQKFVYE
jgi:enterochelin esterase-like enzyme